MHTRVYRKCCVYTTAKRKPNRTCVSAHNQAGKVRQVPGQPVRSCLEVPLVTRQIHQSNYLLFM